MVKKYLDWRILKYLFFGGVTVLVNVACFYLLENCLKLNLDVSNIVSTILALLFAYITNTWFVFCTKCNSLKERFEEFLRFSGGRCFTLFLEVLGVHYLVNICFVEEMNSKIFVQILVIILNYVISKMLVYKDRIYD